MASREPIPRGKNKTESHVGVGSRLCTTAPNPWPRDLVEVTNRESGAVGWGFGLGKWDNGTGCGGSLVLKVPVRMHGGEGAPKHCGNINCPKEEGPGGNQPRRSCPNFRCHFCTFRHSRVLCN